MPTLDEVVTTTRHVYTGLFFGTVEDVEDPEKLGRVRVRLAQIHSQDRNAMPTNALPWAPLVAIGGGLLDQGVYWVPQLGSQVVVGFFHGDPAYPLCLGTVYRRAESPVEAQGAPANGASNSSLPTTPHPGSNTTQTLLGATQVQEVKFPNGSRIVNDSATGNTILETNAGSVVLLSDAAGKERIEIQTAGRNNLTLWDGASPSPRIEFTTGYGHRGLLNDDPLDRSVTLTSKDGFYLKLSDTTKDALLQTKAGSKVWLYDVGFGAMPEIRIQSAGNAFFQIQDGGDVVTAQTKGGCNLLLSGDRTAYLATTDGYQLSLGGPSMLIRTPDTAGQIIIQSAGQVAVNAATIALTAINSITLTAPVVNVVKP